MLDRDEVVKVFEGVLGHPPTGTWADDTIAKKQSRESLVAELMNSAEFQDRARRGGAVGTLRDLFSSPGQARRAAPPRQELLQRIQAQFEVIQKLQGNYQPVYGLGAEQEQSPRLENLLFDCARIEEHFATAGARRQIRVLDVGCNLGYVSFRLAEKHFDVVGIDVDAKNIALCRDLASYTGSTAKFAELDFLSCAEVGDLDWENLDCVLLLNVVHQLIFARGIPYVQTFLRRLVKRVDVVFVQLARRQEYARLSKDHLLPEDPAAILSECEDCEIKLLNAQDRPLYRITRRRSGLGPLSIPNGKIFHSASADANHSRKYYMGDGKFMKVFRFTARQNRNAFDRELRGLLKMKGSGLAPEVLDWAITPAAGAVLMEALDGSSLGSAYGRFREPDALQNFLRNYLQIADRLGKSGLYHNDLSAHNLLVRENGDLFAIDFEQADATSFIDHFAVMLWTVYDILKGENISYRQMAYRHLYKGRGIQRADKAHYPDFSGMELSTSLREFIARAESSPSWFDFVKTELQTTTLM